jgi:hypothetical protein
MLIATGGRGRGSLSCLLGLLMLTGDLSLAIPALKFLTGDAETDHVAFFHCDESE